eukprot:TRINITY_DN12787_c0_g2_i1.p1 TRINITY_DN12787_c0_g2~~TRINITY_DN12787_c0_g2_i1.p1  ORF type:complete len:381 (+),score=45.86 TRINITY_DN12787_c0_g2_i1:72-1145(+)
MEKLRKLQLLRMFVLVALWGVCGFFVVKLSIDYVKTGRKNTINIDIYQIHDLSVPWLYAQTDLGVNCYLRSEGCDFITINATGYPSLRNCTPAIFHSDKGEYILLSSITTRELGMGYTNPMDFVKLVFTVRFKETGELVNPNMSIMDQCKLYVPESSAWVGLLGDDVTMTALTKGETINERDMPAPIHIGFGNVAAISYKLSQQEYINGSIKNSSEFTTTQFKDVPFNEIEVHLLPATFDVMKIKHKEGQSLLDLMGSVFGWIGVFTGACIFSVLDTAIMAYSEGGKYAKKKNESKEEPLYFCANEMPETSEATMRDVMDELKALRSEVEVLRYRGATPQIPTPPPQRTLSYKSQSI